LKEEDAVENKEREFVPSDRQITIADGGDYVYLKPIGGDRASIYMGIRIAGGALVFGQNPFAPFEIPCQPFDRGIELDAIAEAMQGGDEKPLLQNRDGDVVITIFRFDSVDLTTSSMVITLDAEVEVYDPAT
jgi:hypothetical protein